jgi:ubiquinone biosynthesis accessory factor UbiK
VQIDLLLLRAKFGYNGRKFSLAFVSMPNRHLLDVISQKIAAQLPDDPGVWAKDLRRNLRATVQAALEDVELVSREEFDIQRAVLQRTREKLEALELQLAELETKLKP